MTWYLLRRGKKKVEYIPFTTNLFLTLVYSWTLGYAGYWREKHFIDLVNEKGKTKRIWIKDQKN